MTGTKRLGLFNLIGFIRLLDAGRREFNAFINFTKRQLASNERLAELAELLEQMHRPLESLSWQAVRIADGSSTLPEEGQQSQLVEINSRRLQLIASHQPTVTEQFIHCGVDSDSIESGLAGVECELE